MDAFAYGVGAGAGGYCHYGAGAELAIHSSIRGRLLWCPDYGSLMARRMVAAALCCWIVSTVKGYQPAVPRLLSVAFILMLARRLIGRGRILWAAYDRGHGGDQLTDATHLKLQNVRGRVAHHTIVTKNITGEGANP